MVESPLYRMNKFQIKNLECIVIIGSSPNIAEIVRIIEDLNLDYGIVTSPAQLPLFPKEYKPRVFEKLDEEFIAYIKHNYNIENTLFVSIAARWIFREKIFSKLLNIVNN